MVFEPATVDDSADEEEDDADAEFIQALQPLPGSSAARAQPIAVQAWNGLQDLPVRSPVQDILPPFPNTPNLLILTGVEISFSVYCIMREHAILRYDDMKYEVQHEHPVRMRMIHAYSTIDVPSPLSPFLP